MSSKPSRKTSQNELMQECKIANTMQTWPNLDWSVITFPFPYKHWTMLYIISCTSRSPNSTVVHLDIYLCKYINLKDRADKLVKGSTENLELVCDRKVKMASFDFLSWGLKWMIWDRNMIIKFRWTLYNWIFKRKVPITTNNPLQALTKDAGQPSVFHYLYR